MFAIRKINTLAATARTVGVTTIKKQKHTLPVLAYEYNALEPVISRDIMCLHHSQHHAAYVNNLNAAEEMLACAMSKDPGLSLDSNPGYIFDFNLSPVFTVPLIAFDYVSRLCFKFNTTAGGCTNLDKARANGDISKVVNLTQSIRFNGGGHINHTIFWQNLSPNGGKPSEKLVKNVEK
ncbi:Superoxide dismutase, mitochondrial [Eumeta japonica]|uniref:superoxide dismutase n=1 Tax=Eumeta variegata TaxID=151549 RepID=A0A4C1UPL6_EUMVA|nr:Superoxide dismutase, mitochondrial [Eumeta japonica]